MPRISRGSATNSPSQEPVRNATSPSSPNAAGGSAAGRRERHGLLGFLARPFRGSGSSARASGPSASAPQQAEQAPAARAAPRTAAALLQRSPVLARGQGDEVMARIAQAPADAPGPSAQGSPARGALTRQPVPSGLQPRPTNSPVGNSQTPPRAQGSAVPSPGRRTRGANTSLMGRLAGSGIDMGRLETAIDDTMRNGRELPDEIRGVLQRAGIETHIGAGRISMDHPLLQLRREIYLATRDERDPSPPREERMPRTARRPRLGFPPIGSSRPQRAAANAALVPPEQAEANTALSLPAREDEESNLQYALRLRRLNPGASVAHIANAVVRGHDGNPSEVIRSLRAHISACEKLVAKFSELRPISKADAEALGFKDAAEHGEDHATQCMFGGGLSLTNRKQMVIGLAQGPSAPPAAYHAGKNKSLEFMDLNKLAEFLTGQPRHPTHRAPLNEQTIQDYAFRIE